MKASKDWHWMEAARTLSKQMLGEPATLDVTGSIHL